jgi:hypothetical protein
MRAGALRTHLGHFRRAEAPRKGELNLVGHLLGAKHQNGIFLERGPHRLVGRIRCDIRKRHAAELGGESWPQRDNVHRGALPVLRRKYARSGAIVPFTTKSIQPARALD